MAKACRRPRGVATLRPFRIDDDHSNAYEAWLRMGSPQNPTPAQHTALQAAGRLAELEPPREITVEGGGAKVEFRLPRRGVSLVELEWR
jgi:xylan 1,4-beta-xylosidase